MKVKIFYRTPYAGSEVNGYVMAEKHADYYTITRSQFLWACKKLTIGGDIAPVFISELPVYTK